MAEVNSNLLQFFTQHYRPGIIGLVGIGRDFLNESVSVSNTMPEDIAKAGRMRWFL